MDIYPLQSGQIAAQSLNNIGNIFLEMKERHKKDAQLKDSYSTIAEQLGFDKNYVKTLSLGETMGLVEGKKAQMQQRQVQLQEQQFMAAEEARTFSENMREREQATREQQQQSALEMLEMQRREAAYKAQQQQAQALFYKDLARYAPAGQLSAPLSPDYELQAGQQTPGVMQMLQSASRSGYNVPPNVLDDMYRAMGNAKPTMFGAQDMGRAYPLIGPNGEPVPGRYVYPTSPNSAGYFEDKSVTNPPVAQPPAPNPIYSQDNLFYWDPKKGTWRPRSEGNPMVSYFKDLINPTNGQPSLVVPGTPTPQPAPAKPYAVYKRGPDGKMVKVEEVAK